MQKFYYISVVLLILNFGYSQCPGDTNLDSTINIQDVILIVNHVLDIELLEDEGLDNADANNDGGINILDVVTLVNMVLSNEYNPSADINNDGVVNVLDVVGLVNIILSF